jgi:hypothetical protein
MRLIGPFLAATIVLTGCSETPASPTAVAADSAMAQAVPGAASSATTMAAGGRRASGGVVYVTGQGLYYDTFVTRDPLPMRGPFQPIGDSDGDGIAETPYGPGDQGYVGGRWWMDVNGNGIQDEGDHFFLCPLLGPGRPTP